MIKIIQLAAGEQLISEISADEYELTNPLFINIVANERGGNITLHPYDLIVSGPITVNPNQIVWTGDPEQKLLNQYQEVFSKIITPPSNVTSVLYHVLISKNLFSSDPPLGSEILEFILKEEFQLSR